MKSNSSLPTDQPAVNMAEPVEDTSDTQYPDASMLEDRVPEWAQLSRTTVIWTILLGLLWLFFSYQPLWHTDLWGHVYYGKIIVEQRHIPATEPALPLAQGVPFRDTAWLSQVIAYLGYCWQGESIFRFMFAVCLFFSTIAMLTRFRQQTPSIGISLLGLIILLAVVWKSLYIVRPQLAGWTCYVLLFSFLVGKKWSNRYWLIVPLLFVCWANLHGSFVMGLGLLATFCLGKFIDIWFRTGQLASAFKHKKVRRYFLLTELALLAVLINPYGIGLLSAVETIASNPNLRSLIEWEPVTLRMTHGQGFALSVIALGVAYRLSQRRVSAVEVLLLIGFGWAALWSVRMMVWWTPLAAWYFVSHAESWRRARLLRRHNNRTTTAAAENSETVTDEASIIRSRSGLNTVLVLGLCWIFFATTPFATRLLHGEPQDPEQAERFYRGHLSKDTPVDLARYLQEHPPTGLVFNTYEWGDYLLWAGPEGISLFLNSHAHLLPVEVWDDYFVIAAGGSAAFDKLDRYGVNTIVVDHKFRDRLIEALKENSDWKLDYQDTLGAIFIRRAPINNQ